TEIHYAFRGRLVILLAPARGMSTLPAKGGFSRPSSFTHSGGSPMPFLPQDKESFFEKHRTQKKWFSFSSSLRVFPPLVLCLSFSYHCYWLKGGCLERRTVDSSKIQTNFLRTTQFISTARIISNNIIYESILS